MQHDNQTNMATPRPAERLDRDDRAGQMGPELAASSSRRDLPYKMPVLAGFLSGFFPGVGQLYVGYYRDGITLAILFAGIITLLAGGDMSPLVPFFAITLGFIWLYGIIDAVRRAQAVNRYLDGCGQEPLPENLAALGGGSLFGGAVLVVLGVITLLHTRFDVDMLWLADWWPLILIGLGAWLIWKARRDQRS